MTGLPQGLLTPQILINLDILDRNIDRVAKNVAGKGLALRPHAKTHKMHEIAGRQLEAGAVGLTVATIGEALTFALHGVGDLFVAYPLWISDAQAKRIRELLSYVKLSLGTDSIAAVQQLARQLADKKDKLGLMIEIDSGHHRSGVLPDEALDVARAAREAGLNVIGIFTFPGHSYAPGKPQEVTDQEQHALGEAARLLRADGFELKRISGGSTPTAELADNSLLTEVRPGVYVFGDAQQFELGRCQWENIALSVASTVISRHEGDAQNPRRIVLDAGSKILGSDRPGWATGFGRILENPDARISAISEHHATVLWPEGQPLPAYGDQLRVIPNHVCVAVNLVDQVCVVRDGEVLEHWDVAARGLNF